MSDFLQGLTAWRDICRNAGDCDECPLVYECPIPQEQVVGDLDDEQVETLANSIEEEAE